MSRRNRHSRTTSAHRFSASTHLQRGAQVDHITTSMGGCMDLMFLHYETPMYLLLKRMTRTTVKLSVPSIGAMPLQLFLTSQMGGVCVILVGVRGLEPPTSASRTLRASRLRYTPVTST